MTPFGPLSTLSGLILDRAGRSLYRIGEHENRRLAGLGLRPRVAKVLFLDRPQRGVGIALRLLVKVGHQLRAVMLRDDVHDLLGEPRFTGHLDTVLDMRGDDQRRHRRGG